MFYPASHPEIKKHIVQIDEIIVRRTETELTCLRLLSDIGDGILKTIQKGKLLLSINMAIVSTFGLLEEYNRSKHLQHWKWYYPKYQVRKKNKNPNYLFFRILRNLLPVW